MVTNRPSLAAFIIPFLGKSTHDLELLDTTLQSCVAQTDDRWVAVIVDDGSLLSPGTFEQHIPQRYIERIHVLRLNSNRGPGVARNQGVTFAKDLGADVVLYLDADDIAAPTRLERTMEVLTTRPEVDFVYSDFSVIDEESREIADSDLTPSLLEICDCLANQAPQGAGAWIDIGTQTGYATLTSTVAMRTALAWRCPFPAERISEDQHTWFRCLASGGSLYFIPEKLARYRVANLRTSGSNSRGRSGRENFYREKSRVDTAGFLEACRIALENQRLDALGKAQVLRQFHERMALTFHSEGMMDLVAYHSHEAKRAQTIQE